MAVFEMRPGTWNLLPEEKEGLWMRISASDAAADAVKFRHRFPPHSPPPPLPSRRTVFSCFIFLFSFVPPPGLETIANMSSIFTAGSVKNDVHLLFSSSRRLHRSIRF